jgi:hypothetical protein
MDILGRRVLRDYIFRAIYFRSKISTKFLFIITVSTHWEGHFFRSYNLILDSFDTNMKTAKKLKTKEGT